MVRAIVLYGLILRGIVKMVKRQQLQRAGFTLIELTLYIAIFSVVIGAIVGLGIAATAQRVKSQVMADVTYQGEAIMAAMTQSVRDASSVTTPTLGQSSSSLTLVTPYVATTPTVYDASSDGVRTRLRIREGAAQTANFLTNSHVTISNLTFVNNGLTGTSGSISISFTLTYQNPTGRDEYSYSKNFFGGANLP